MSKEFWFFLVVMWLVFSAVSCSPKAKNGSPGLQGPPGETGEDADITVVQLCKSCTTHYPDTFAEVAFCVNDKLYATYSANGGFSVEMPPGQYSSNGINCSCVMTVLPHCEIQ